MKIECRCSLSLSAFYPNLVWWVTSVRVVTSMIREVLCVTCEAGSLTPRVAHLHERIMFAIFLGLGIAPLWGLPSSPGIGMVTAPSTLGARATSNVVNAQVSTIMSLSTDRAASMRAHEHPHASDDN